MVMQWYPINTCYLKKKSGENDHENMQICKQKVIPHKRDNTKIHTVCNIWLMVLWLSDTCTSICAARPDHYIECQAAMVNY